MGCPRSSWPGPWQTVNRAGSVGPDRMARAGRGARGSGRCPGGRGAPSQAGGLQAWGSPVLRGGVSAPPVGVCIWGQHTGVALCPRVAPDLGILVAQGEESACSAGAPGSRLGWDIPWGRAWQPLQLLLAWRSPWTGDPDGLQSTRSQSPTDLATETTPEQLQSVGRRRIGRRGDAPSAHNCHALPVSWMRPCPACSLHPPFAPCLCPKPPSTVALGRC